MGSREVPCFLIVPLDSCGILRKASSFLAGLTWAVGKAAGPYFHGLNASSRFVVGAGTDVCGVVTLFRRGAVEGLIRDFPKLQIDLIGSAWKL